MSTSRLGGDYSAEALEAFRAAYAAQLQTPEDLDTHKETGLPSSEISNTAPWYSSVGLWKYPSGKGPDDDLRQPFNSDGFLPQDDTKEDSELDEFLDGLSLEELMALSKELEEDDEDSEPMTDEEEPDDLDGDEEDGEQLTEEEIESIIDEILEG